MKQIKFIRFIILLTGGILLASCMGKDYAEPTPGEGSIADIEELNLKTIKQVKDQYAMAINTNGYQQIKEDIQIKGYVTGNDIEGNLYQQISLQDETGAVILSVAKGGLSGEVGLGQQILLNLKDLYIGGYGGMAEIGGVYTNTNSSSSNYGTHSIGRMDRYQWASHFTKIGEANEANLEKLVQVFKTDSMTDAKYIKEKTGMLMTITGVSFKDANGTNTYAPDNKIEPQFGGCVHREFKEYPSKDIVVRTSTFADFAGNTLPTGKVAITGVFSHYSLGSSSTWQILMRRAGDVADATPQKGQDASDPLSVTEALAAYNAGTLSGNIYVKGIIAKIDEVSTSFGNAQYWISDDGKTTAGTMIEVWRGKYLNNEKFTATDQIKVGQTVVVLGTLKEYNGTIEFDQGNYIISIK
ncbi:DUF5689 domain-containing protein [Prevotella sp. KH2C16]|uniref:DUF5689 domain-containing protein n=1 Tax=Prevotella sp. KH2C16 TaxID=1855325 RepID=UPI0008E647B0|nr:DUF5689 domain-containing protein [Prevotella sp. KH2C16]SFG61890.1 hypothetical protein SAMN05216383_12313 [Prevotella sp. KH2C16]